MYDFKHHKENVCNELIEQIHTHAHQINKYHPDKCSLNETEDGVLFLVIAAEGMTPINRMAGVKDAEELKIILSIVRGFTPADCDPVIAKPRTALPSLEVQNG
tara:strand:+ start:315 stop:623 length:309 start_codon:yes stop_codon:yes gene_type:complete